MKISRFFSALIAVSAFGLANCSNESPTTSVDASVAKDERKVNIDPQLEQFVAQARGDLADRLEIDEADIAVIDAGFVTWPNSSLGCPEDDMMYTQALVPGYRIRFEAAGQRHAYHGSTGKPPFHCPAERAREPAAGPAKPKDVY